MEAINPLQQKVEALESVVETLQGRVQYLELKLGVSEGDRLQWQISTGIHDPESWQQLNEWSLGK